MRDLYPARQGNVNLVAPPSALNPTFGAADMSRILIVSFMAVALAGCGSTHAMRTATGAVIGAGSGALAGAAIAGTGGAVVGGLGGAAVGAVVGSSQ